MQTDSTRASSGLSIGFPLRSVCWKAGMVLRIIPNVEITTNNIEMEDMALAAPLVSGFSKRSQRNFWYGTNLPVPKSSTSSMISLPDSASISSSTCSLLVANLKVQQVSR